MQARDCALVAGGNPANSNDWHCSTGQTVAPPGTRTARTYAALARQSQRRPTYPSIRIGGEGLRATVYRPDVNRGYYRSFFYTVSGHQYYKIYSCELFERDYSISDSCTKPVSFGYSFTNVDGNFQLRIDTD